MSLVYKGQRWTKREISILYSHVMDCLNKKNYLNESDWKTISLKLGEVNRPVKSCKNKWYRMQRESQNSPLTFEEIQIMIQLIEKKKQFVEIASTLKKSISIIKLTFDEIVENKLYDFYKHFDLEKSANEYLLKNVFSIKQQLHLLKQKDHRIKTLSNVEKIQKESETISSNTLSSSNTISQNQFNNFENLMTSFDNQSTNNDILFINSNTNAITDPFEEMEKFLFDDALQ